MNDNSLKLQGSETQDVNVIVKDNLVLINQLDEITGKTGWVFINHDDAVKMAKFILEKLENKI